MKKLFLIVFLFATLTLPAQVLDLGGSTTRAVVIGISDYQDPGIPDLRFAHRDADAPAFWLQSPASGSMAPENINQFTNWMATAARFAADTGRTSFKESEKQGTSECH